MNFDELRKINVNDHVEQKNGLTYLSWAWAWDAFKQKCPDAIYEIVKNENGLPYFESEAGAMVYTKVTTGGITHEMWLPVMDGANKAMKRESYSYRTYKGEKVCEAFDMFDVNKTIMRCLVKNLAMFGLGLYIYAGEDLPDDPEEQERLLKINKLLEEIKKGNVISKQFDAWENIKPLCKDENETANIWLSIDSTTRRQIKQHGEDLRAGDTEEKPLSELILG